VFGGKLKRERAIIAAIALGGCVALSMASSAAATAVSSHARPSRVSHPPKVTWKYGVSGCSGNDCGQYLQIAHAGKKDGDWAEIRKGKGDKNETWYAILLNNSQYAFKNLNSLKCLNDRASHPLGHVDQHGCGHYPNDNRWFQTLGLPHTYALQNVSNQQGACLGVNRWVTFGAIGAGNCFWH
jgi:hypothetical protein